MERQQQDRYLSTREVAEKCGTSESTVRYSARVGTLNGAKIRNAWQFAEADANAFCEGLRERRKVLPLAARTRKRRLLLGRLDTKDFVNYLAALVTIATFLGIDRYHVVGVALAAANIGWAGLRRIRAKIREPQNSDVLHGEPVDLAAVIWRRKKDESPLFLAGQSAALFFTGGFVLFTVLTLWDDDKAQLTINPEHLRPGDVMVLAGQYFPTNAWGMITHPNGEETTFRTDAEGDFRLSLNAPAAPPGTHRLTAAVGNTEAAASFTMFQLEEIPASTPPSGTDPTITPESTATETLVIDAATTTPIPTITATPTPTLTPTSEPVPTWCGWPPDAIPVEWGGEPLVATDGLNMRSGPSADCEIVRTLSSNEIVTLRSEPYPSEGTRWVYVMTTDESRGWVQEEFLSPLQEREEFDRSEPAANPNAPAEEFDNPSSTPASGVT